MRNLGNYTLLVLLILFCSNKLVAQDFLTTSSGLKYKYLLKSDSGIIAGEGGYIEAHIVVKAFLKKENRDTIIINSYKDKPGPNKILIPKPTYKGCINEGFAMLKAGDSIVFKVPADSLYNNTFKASVPSFLTGKDEIEIITKVLFSQTKLEFEQKLEAAREEQVISKKALLEKELKQLSQVADKMGYADELDKTPGGVLFAKIKETNGVKAQEGDVGSFFYKGTFLDGAKFDGNYGGTPFNVTIGKGGVIQGWLEVVADMKLGEKWIIFIPSSLAYGENGSGRIPPNTPLIFEIELNEIQKVR